LIVFVLGPLNIFHAGYETDNAPIRLSYHQGNHYNSVRDLKNPSVGVGLGLPGLRDRKGTENMVLEKARRESENVMIEDQILQVSCVFLCIVLIFSFFFRKAVF